MNPNPLVHNSQNFRVDFDFDFRNYYFVETIDLHSLIYLMIYVPIQIQMICMCHSPSSPYRILATGLHKKKIDKSMSLPNRPLLRADQIASPFAVI